jgi:chromosome segregation ATPase
LENFNIKQENTIKNLENEISQLNNELENKDVKYKQLDKSYLSIIRVIEEHKKTIRKLQDQLNRKNTEEKNWKVQIYEKEQEISLLRSFINSIKHENSMRASPSQNNISMRQSAKKNKNVNSNQNTVLPKINSAFGKRNDTSLNNENNNFTYNYNNNNINFEVDPEEENMKGINALMNKILNE